MVKSNSKQSNQQYCVALAGNPNVGKSTVFNSLTGLHQHTGNWAGKTVENARGRYCFKGSEYTLVDLPGTYSLFSRSFEEIYAEEFLSFGKYDAVVVVADANCLERNLNLVLQITEITSNVILAVNLMDEAEKNGVSVDCRELSLSLGIPVVPMSAGKNRGLDALQIEIEKLCKIPIPPNEEKSEIDEIEKLSEKLDLIEKDGKNSYYAMRMLQDISYTEQYFKYKPIDEKQEFIEYIEKLRVKLLDSFQSHEDFCDYLVNSIDEKVKKTAQAVVSCADTKYKNRLQNLDRIFMGKVSGFITMLFLLLLVLWITIYGANYPSQWLSSFLSGFEMPLVELFERIHAPKWLTEISVYGGYRVLSWVVSVMLPPMAIFFPLFTLLEDFGYLPRVAFNLDYYFKKANTCGKQALTMCMGFGCNAVGVTGCRIIDSPRERLIAILTNAFVPCNGRFPTLIAIISMFFLITSNGFFNSILSSLLLCGVIVFGIFSTFAVSKVLSKTLLKGVPSSFTLELPPYRKPQIGKVLVRSVFDRILFVLGRAVCVAFPAGLIIWIFANITVGDKTILLHITEFLDIPGKALGMDGVILTAFILGLPANEIVLPIILMAYMGTGTLTEYSSLASLHELLVQNGWTVWTALCVTVFTLMHWPCSTTLLTVKKETNSIKWTLLSFIIPTVCGMAICLLINILSKLTMLI